MVVQGLTKRLSKLDAAKELEVSPTTIDRMISPGRTPNGAGTQGEPGTRSGCCCPMMNPDGANWRTS